MSGPNRFDLDPAVPFILLYHIKKYLFNILPFYLKNVALHRMIERVHTKNLINYQISFKKQVLILVLIRSVGDPVLDPVYFLLGNISNPNHMGGGGATKNLQKETVLSP